MTATPDARRGRDRAVLMTALLVIAAALVASAVILTRGGDSPGPGAAVTERSDPHAPREVSKDVLNAVDKITRTASQAELVARGRELFRSSAVAKDGESCQSCHTDGGANADVGTTPHGIPGDVDQSFVGPRDPPTLFNVGRTDPYFWIGDVATLNEVSIATMQNHFLPTALGNLNADAAALTVYMESIRPPTTDFDRGTMSAGALRGLELFQGKAGCVECHGGPDFTDNLFHNTLVPQAPPMFSGAPANNDRGKQAPSGANAGKICPMTLQDLNALVPAECAFNTPTLRGNGLAGTAPFMHNGFCGTASALPPSSGGGPDLTKCDSLVEVVRFYNTASSVAPLNLTVQEQTDLVEFLKEL